MIRDKLVDWMPDYYKGRNVNEIQKARDAELAGLENTQKRIIGDMYVSRAQDIELWEKEYGVESPGGSLMQRQQNMLAYIRGSGGAVTKEMIVALINSYTGTDATEIAEYADESIIRITCHLLPTSVFDLGDMTELLYRLIQAHVGVIIDAIWYAEAESALRFGTRYAGGYIVNPVIIT